MYNQYSYMSKVANFGLLRNAVEITASAGAGGLLFGGGYVGAKAVQGENFSKKDVKNELAANVAGGVAQGVGGYLLTKALSGRL